MGTFKNWIVRSKEILSAEDVSARLKKIETSLELQYVDKFRAEITKEQTTALADLVRALDGVDEAAIQIGSLLIIKCTNSDKQSSIYSRSLTQNELLLIEEKPELLKAPASLLSRLGD